jgi:hypothetical protein
MRDKPKSGMNKKAKKHSDEREDKKLAKDMVKKKCMK